MRHRVVFEYEVPEQLEPLFREKDAKEAAQNIFQQPLNDLKDNNGKSLIENEAKIVFAEYIDD